MAKFWFGSKLFKRMGIDQNPLLCHSLWSAEWLLAGSLMLLMRGLPTDTAAKLGNKLGQCLGPRTAKHATFHQALQLAFPQASDEQRRTILKQVWGNMGSMLAETAHLKTIIDSRMAIETPQAADFLHSNKPKVFCSAHLSHFYVGLASLMQLKQPVYCMYAPIQNKRIERLLHRYRQPLGCQFVPTTANVRTLIRHLDQGGILVATIDQRTSSKRGGVPIPFFGLTKHTTLVPAKLALRHNADFIPSRVMRTADNHYRIVYYAPIKPAADATSNTAKAISMTTQAHQLFETWIRDSPGDWICQRFAKKKSSAINDTP